ncbi:hypothetical protein FFLO_00630 [Filobasidium floriforme]|uniref:Uncharacterized protein n=1 Tax=Filobasidium floriforme TaxID=5210 RepID=A0A8K0JR63_9TREE|nr:hypothetical protein FFLO_00630 [Filobasidium floriforme]
MFPRTSRSTSTSSSPLSLFDHSQRAQMGQDLFYLFGCSSNSASSSSSTQPKKPKTAIFSRRPAQAGEHYDEKHGNDNEDNEGTEADSMFITWPESRPIGTGSRSASPNSSDLESESESSYSSSSSSGSAISLPDYHTPNTNTKTTTRSGLRSKKSAKDVRGLFRPSSTRTQSAPDLPTQTFPRSPQQLRISVKVETTTSTSSQAKWELDLDLPAQRSGMRRNGPGGRGDRWNGNWV